MSLQTLAFAKRRGISLFVAFASVSLGACAVAAPRMALLLTAVALVLPLVVCGSLWLVAAWVLLAGLAVLSYGFNNIPFGFGAWQMPIAEVLLVALLIAAFTEWKIVFTDRRFRPVALPLLALTIIAIPRLLVDVPHYGATAFRDALYVIDAWAFLIGVVLVRRMSCRSFERRLGQLFRVCVLWFALFPAGALVERLGPMVGIQKPVPLLSFTSASFLGAAALLWFLEEGRPTSLAFGLLALAALLFSQIRSMYIAVPISLLLLSLLRRRPAGGDQTAIQPKAVWRFAGLACVAFLLLTLLPPLPGRLGEVRPSFLASHALTLAGDPGPGSGSMRQREQWWPDLLDRVDSAPLGWLVGVGYGPDLIGGFRDQDGTLVRKPHNDPLEVYARTGLLGVTAWGALFIGVIRITRRGVGRHPFAARWALAVQPVFFLFSLTQPLFSFAYGGIVYFMLFGGVTQLLMGPPKATGTLDPRSKETAGVAR